MSFFLFFFFSSCLLSLQAKEYRDEAMSGTVSDEVRRSRAEAMAIALSNILGVDDDDEDDSDDSDEDRN
jgi:hypothetical protein